MFVAAVLCEHTYRTNIANLCILDTIRIVRWPSAKPEPEQAPFQPLREPIVSSSVASWSNDLVEHSINEKSALHRCPLSNHRGPCEAVHHLRPRFGTASDWCCISMQCQGHTAIVQVVPAPKVVGISHRVAFRLCPEPSQLTLRPHNPSKPCLRIVMVH